MRQERIDLPQGPSREHGLIASHLTKLRQSLIAQIGSISENASHERRWRIARGTATCAIPERNIIATKYFRKTSSRVASNSALVFFSIACKSRPSMMPWIFFRISDADPEISRVTALDGTPTKVSRSRRPSTLWSCSSAMADASFIIWVSLFLRPTSPAGLSCDLNATTTTH